MPALLVRLSAVRRAWRGGEGAVIGPEFVLCRSLMLTLDVCRDGRSRRVGASLPKHSPKTVVERGRCKMADDVTDDKGGVKVTC